MNFRVLLALCAALLSFPAHAQAPLRALIVGGGPDLSHNQVAIESNVRYVRRLLPPGTQTRTLFANGNPQSANVLYEDAQGHERYRPSQLASVDGPSRFAAFGKAFQSLTAEGNGPLLLYFTGHGSPGDDSYDNNFYDLWGNDTLSVTQLTGYLDKAPAQTPVALVMVECFSGAFGNVLFAGGKPAGAVTDKDRCGFFASVPSREAAGCTSEVNEAEYHDFTSYFFAALTGTDRVGRTVTGADYNHDGMVGMDEAFAYTLIHDPSIDTPVCTSDVYLRRFVSAPEASVFQRPYATVREWASPAQGAVLDALCAQLHLTGNDRLALAYATFLARTRREDKAALPEPEEEMTARWTRLVRTAKSVVLAHLLAQYADAPLRARYAALLVSEARNPLRPIGMATPPSPAP